MESVASAVVEKVKSFVKSGEDFVTGLNRRRNKSSDSRNPIEILKRLQREAFSDLMKLRDRQEKVERVLTVYKTSKAGPFEGDRPIAGIRTGTVSWLVFGTTVRQKDSLEAEFATSLNRDGYGGSKDVAAYADPSAQENGLTDYSSYTCSMAVMECWSLSSGPLGLFD
ncbi:hypothetical protein AKJ16_DCAP26365 [Drosera capensis]